MKKKLLILIGILTVILSFGYSAKADTCTYDLHTPSNDFKTRCLEVCDAAYQNPKPTDADYNDDTKYRNAACNSWCYSYKATDVDRNCYCLKKAVNYAGDECYNEALLNAMEKEKWGKKKIDVKVVVEEARNTTAMEAACKAIANCFKGDYNAYTNTYNGCMNVNVTCNTDTTCGQKLCEKDNYKNSKFCLTGAFSPTQYCSNKDANIAYSYGAGNNGTAGTIKDDLNYISNITLSNCFGFGEIVYYTSLVIKILQIAAPIILIIWASIDLFKSMIAGDEKKIIEMRKPILQRFIAAALVFLVPWIVSTIVNNFSSNADWLVCWKKNRFTYSREDDKGGTYVNSLHNVQNEQGYIKFSCTEVCASDSKFDTCKEKCMNTYWESSIPCYNSVPNNGSTKAEDINAARVSCYNEFATEFYNRYTSQSGN